MAELISLEEAQAKLLALAPAPDITLTPTALSLGQYLAGDLIALRTQPSADLSAMDGYAICGSGPWNRVGESRAGAPFDGQLHDGQCVRISTGAHMPAGSDRVLIQENATSVDDRIAASDVPEPGRHVRKRGFDFSTGDNVLKQGTRMGPGQIALAISAGHDSIPHAEAPRIAALDSGDELVKLAARAATHQIPASNAPMIAAMLSPLVGPVDQLGPAPDDLDALAAALENADGSILITSGGASVGDHDLMQQALINWGAELAFWKVAIKPGKPLMVATRETEGRKQIILGLPGNPVSSFVTCFLFALPLVRKMMGDPNPLPKSLPATLGVELPAIGSRQEFLRGVWDGETVVLAASQDSSALQALAASNCLINRPPHAGAAAAGDQVSIYPL